MEWRVALLVALSAARAAWAQTPTDFQTAARYSAEHDGDAVLVFRHDTLLLEDYQNGFDGTSPHALASGTKTFACVLAALAGGDGLLRLDEPVAGTLAEFQSDSLMRRVTIRHLLNLTSGLDGDVVTPPGRRFVYGGVGFSVFGAVMARKLRGEDLVAYLTRRVLAPLDIAVADWQRDADGRPGLASGASMTARAWGRFGLLLLHRGRWKGRQLVSGNALAECGHGSAANPGYGLGLWLNAPDPRESPPPGVERAGPRDRLISAPDLPHDLWMAAGSGGQRLYILPSEHLVAVRFGHNTGPDYRDDVFLRTLLGR